MHCAPPLPSRGHKLESRCLLLCFFCSPLSSYAVSFFLIQFHIFIFSDMFFGDQTHHVIMLCFLCWLQCSSCFVAGWCFWGCAIPWLGFQVAQEHRCFNVRNRRYQKKKKTSRRKEEEMFQWCNFFVVATWLYFLSAQEKKERKGNSKRYSKHKHMLSIKDVLKRKPEQGQEKILNHKAGWLGL